MAVENLGPGELIAEITADLSTLVRKEIELAKQEVGEGLKEKAIGAGLFIVAGVVGLFLLPFVLLTVIFVLAIWLPLWAASLIVTGAMILIAGAIGMVAVKKIKAKIAPERTIRTLKEDVAWARRRKS